MAPPILEEEGHPRRSWYTVSLEIVAYVLLFVGVAGLLACTLAPERSSAA